MTDRYQGMSLGDAMPLEQARVREVIALYRSLGPSGAPAAYLMEQDLAAADRAVMSGDVAQMIVAFKKLQGWEA